MKVRLRYDQDKTTLRKRYDHAMTMM